jgi:hypothetical protein
VSTPRKFAIVVLLACASTGVALPLYQEVIPMPSGPPIETYWAGWPHGIGVLEAPVFWLLPALALTASVLTMKNRPRAARTLVLGLLAAQIGLAFTGSALLRSEEASRWKISMIQSGPGPAFYPVGAVLLAAFLLLATTGSSSPPPGRP